MVYVGYVVEKLDLIRHYMTKVVDIKEDTKDKFKAKSSGDIIEIDGEQYIVETFLDALIKVKNIGTGKSMYIEKSSQYELVYSKYYANAFLTVEN